MQKKSIVTSVMIALVGLCAVVGSMAYAQSPASTEPPRSKWEFDLIPYFWMAGLSGDMTVKGVPVHVSESFSDIWSNLDFGAQMHMEGRKDRWGLFLDVTYLNLSSSGEAKRVRTGPGGELQLTTEIQADVSIKEWLVEFGGTYNVARWPLGAEGTAVGLDILGGGRIWSVDTDIDAGVKQSLGDFGRYLYPSISANKSWIDPFVGARLLFDLPKNFFVALRGDVGGFDVGSKISFNMSGYVGYNISRVVSLLAGYRALYVDYESGSGTDKFVFNAWMYGPAIGMMVHF
jgi:hypothetical protein